MTSMVAESVRKKKKKTFTTMLTYRDGNLCLWLIPTCMRFIMCVGVVAKDAKKMIPMNGALCCSNCKTTCRDLSNVGIVHMKGHLHPMERVLRNHVMYSKSYVIIYDHICNYNELSLIRNNRGLFVGRGSNVPNSMRPPMALPCFANAMEPDGS